ncbi:hypothetical protein EIQ04_04705 [Xanthomonas campestris pv. raphani]
MAALLLVVAPAISRWIEPRPQLTVIGPICGLGHPPASEPAVLAHEGHGGRSPVSGHALPLDAACEQCVLAALLLRPHDWTWRHAAHATPLAGRNAYAARAPHLAGDTAHRPRGPPMLA